MNSKKTKEENASNRKPIHHTFLFWVGFVLMLLGILYYIFSEDFRVVP